jgi:RNA polymerase sigma-70 factor (ECF subfamily)
VSTREFDEFYRAEYPRLVGLAVVLLGHRAGAEDLVQDAMVESYRRWDRIGGYDSPSAWVRRVLVQRVVKVARKGSNERVAQLRAGPMRPAPPAGLAGLDPAVLACVQALPAQQRAAVALHYLEDMSVRQIAEELDIAEGTVKAHLSRGRAALSESLGRVAAEGSVSDA